MFCLSSRWCLVDVVRSLALVQFWNMGRVREMQKISITYQFGVNSGLFHSRVSISCAAICSLNMRGGREVRSRDFFFLLQRLNEIKTLTELSFPQLFNTTIETSERADDLKKRMEILLEQTLLTAYVNVARGLFEQHKLIYSFMLCVEIMRQQGVLTDAEWNFFLRGSAGLEKVPVSGLDCKCYSG